MPTTKKTKAKKSNNLGPKKKTLFDHINHIREKKTENYFDTLTDEDKKTFVNYMVNRFLSMDMNLIEVIDQLQKHAVGLKPKDYYRVLREVVPQGRAFHKYIKSTSDDKHNVDLINLVASHYEVSKLHARSILMYSSPPKKELLNLKSCVLNMAKNPRKLKKLCS